MTNYKEKLESMKGKRVSVRVDGQMFPILGPLEEIGDDFITIKQNNGANAVLHFTRIQLLEDEHA